MENRDRSCPLAFGQRRSLIPPSHLEKTEQKNNLLLLLLSPLLQQLEIVLLLLLPVDLDLRHLFVVLVRQVVGLLHLAAGRRHVDAVERNDLLHLRQHSLRVNGEHIRHLFDLLRLVGVVNVRHVVVQHIPDVAAANGLSLELVLKSVHAVYTALSRKYINVNTTSLFPRRRDVRSSTSDCSSSPLVAFAPPPPSPPRLPSLSAYPLPATTDNAHPYRVVLFLQVLILLGISFSQLRHLSINKGTKALPPSYTRCAPSHIVSLSPSGWAVP